MRHSLLTVLTALLLSVSLAHGATVKDETRTTLRAQLLRMINLDRGRFGLRAVELDPSTSALADAYCREQIRSHTTGHFGMDGEAPYMPTHSPAATTGSARTPQRGLPTMPSATGRFTT